MRDRSVHSMICFVLGLMVSFTVEIIRNETAKVGKFVDDFYRFSVGVYSDITCSSSVNRLNENLRLFYIDLHISRRICRPRYRDLPISGG